MKIGELFPTRWVLICRNGTDDQIAKSRDLSYILKRKDELKENYSSDSIEFIIKTSEVMKCRKPNRDFENLPDWEIVHWGVNSSGTFYCSDSELSKIRKLKEKSYE